MTRDDVTRLATAKRAFIAHAKRLRSAKGAKPKTVAQLEAAWEFAKPEVVYAWLAVADAIGPRCARGTLWRKDGSVLNDGCTLPAWHDRTKEPCR